MHVFLFSLPIFVCVCVWHACACVHMYALYAWLDWYACLCVYRSPEEGVRCPVLILPCFLPWRWWFSLILKPASSRNPPVSVPNNSRVKHRALATPVMPGTQTQILMLVPKCSVPAEPYPQPHAHIRWGKLVDSKPLSFVMGVWFDSPPTSWFLEKPVYQGVFVLGLEPFCKVRVSFGPEGKLLRTHAVCSQLLEGCVSKNTCKSLIAVDWLC